MKERAYHLHLLDPTRCPSCHGWPHEKLRPCIIHGVAVCNQCHNEALCVKLDEAGRRDEEAKRCA